MRVPALQNKVWIGLIAAAVVSGFGVAAWLGGNSAPPTGNPPSNISSQPPTQSINVERQVTLYWIATKEKKFVAVPRPISAPSSEVALKTALTTVIAQSVKQPNLYSAIPPQTKVLDFTVKDKDIRLNLSKEFASGGGSASMTGRVVQILYTATSLNPDANLFLSIEGKPLTYLGGEGVEISQPITRESFPLEF